MRVQCYNGDGSSYTCNVYLALGAWNTLSDVNTLIDVGRDPTLIEKLLAASTGVGKKRVEQVVLTHNHYDHVELLPEICDLFAPQVYAFLPFWSQEEGGRKQLMQSAGFHTVKDGDKLKVGDEWCEVVHIPGHSSDSIALYCEQARVLFAGDAPVVVRSPSEYEDDFIEALERLSRRDIRTIYLGHGPPLTENCTELLLESLRLVRRGG